MAGQLRRRCLPLAPGQMLGKATPLGANDGEPNKGWPPIPSAEKPDRARRLIAAAPPITRPSQPTHTQTRSTPPVELDGALGHGTWQESASNIDPTFLHCKLDFKP